MCHSIYEKSRRDALQWADFGLSCNYRTRFDAGEGHSKVAPRPANHSPLTNPQPCARNEIYHISLVPGIHLT
jgi:hypothetical protein